MNGAVWVTGRQTMARDHRKLQVFRLADALVMEAYRMTEHFPKSELFGLRSQIRRATVSIASNIVEGAARDSTKELRRFAQIAAGSAGESRYLANLSSRPWFLNETEAARFDEAADHLLRSLNRFNQRLAPVNAPQV
jgi:four helix bundle protein